MPGLHSTGKPPQKVQKHPVSPAQAWAVRREPSTGLIALLTLLPSSCLSLKQAVIYGANLPHIG